MSKPAWGVNGKEFFFKELGAGLTNPETEMWEQATVWSLVTLRFGNQHILGAESWPEKNVVRSSEI